MNLLHSAAGHRPPFATWAIALLCVLAFLGVEVLHVPALMAARDAWWLVPPGEAFRSARFWRDALPATLLHGGVLHIGVNLWCLLVFGPPCERRYGPWLILLLWIVAGYSGMGIEMLLSGEPKVGLSELTYTLLGIALVHWTALRQKVRQFRTALGMLALNIWGLAEILHLVPTHSGIGHIAHFYGIGLGMAVELVLTWRRAGAVDRRHD